DGLNIKPNGIYADCTAGGGGHSAEILKRLQNGKLIMIDQDPDAILRLTERFKNNANAVIIKGNFGYFKQILNERGIYQVDGVLMDLGVSSYQLDEPVRGFSFHENADLDMRMAKVGKTAAELVNKLPYEELRGIIAVFGEEKYAVSIAKAIVKQREIKPITKTLELAEIIKSAVPQKVRREKHPARKTFQALRVFLNNELDMLAQGLEQAFELLSVGGRLAVISFHSMEARAVTKKMAEWTKGCTCPPDFPICVCGKLPKAKLINKKPIAPSEEEIEANPRSRSARLKVCEKLI
ncbi:MAG: 16S rRNA (cytosine(1402)-N(4))-methyltransferase RsmH, partial [Oscillospiraceae bacterium]|nr:16S rRNA (cytosine(1402)-N(4))-methyltransferase RsmH [Oscillospiraceae bacterium]